MARHSFEGIEAGTYANIERSKKITIGIYAAGLGSALLFKLISWLGLSEQDKVCKAKL